MEQTNTQQIQPLSEDEKIQVFINTSQIQGKQQSRASFLISGNQILKKVILETPSQPENEKETKENFFKDKSLLLNEFEISREILKFKCVNRIQQEEEKVEVENEENLTIEEHFRCHPNCSCIQGRYHLLLPSEYVEFGGRLVMVSPYADQGDAWKYLIFGNMFNNGNSNIFTFIPNNFDQVKLDENLSQLICRARWLLFSSMKLAYQIGSALSHLHDNLNIAHNDIKPDNMFAHLRIHPLLPGSRQMFGRTQYNQDGTVNPESKSEDDDEVAYYLSDFGFAKTIGFNTLNEVKEFFRQKNRHYLAPEILALVDNLSAVNSMNIEKTGDVFAFGVSLFQVLFLVNPFPNNMNQLENPFLLWRDVSKKLKVYSYFTKDINLLKNLLEGMLKKNPLQRFTIQQVLEHPWLSDIRKYLQIKQTQ